MDLLSWVSAAGGTPPASEWTPLSITTLVVAGIGALTGVIALLQNLLRVPKPVWTVKYEMDQIDPPHAVAFRITNRGAMDASDVSVWAGKRRVLGDNHQMWLGGQDVVKPHEAFTFTVDTPLLTEGGAVSTHMVLIYHYAPNASKQRRKVYAFADFDYRKPLWGRKVARLPKRWPH